VSGEERRRRKSLPFKDGVENQQRGGGPNKENGMLVRGLTSTSQQEKREGGVEKYPLKGCGAIAKEKNVAKRFRSSDAKQPTADGEGGG